MEGEPNFNPDINQSQFTVQDDVEKESGIDEIGEELPPVENILTDLETINEQFAASRYKDLISKIQAGDEEAAGLFLKENERLIQTIINKNFGHPSPETRQDLLQEGRLGLWEATRLCDLSRLDKFSTYAGKYIFGYMVRFLYNDTMIHLPEHVYGELGGLKSAQQELGQDGQRIVIAEIAQHLGISEEKVNDLILARRLLRVASIDGYRRRRGIENDYGREHADRKWLGYDPQIEEEIVDQLQGQEMQRKFDFLMDTRLSPKEKQVIQLYYDMNNDETMTQREIALTMSISRERVSRLLALGLQKLRKFSRP